MANRDAQTNKVENPKASDALGYDVYAQTLWARIARALDKDDLGDDPLVVGLFGEWGAGKSYLLKLIETHAREHADTRLGWRKLDGPNCYGLTVPVNFQPWKYEHEPHLHVPMLLHILAALKAELETAQTWWDKAGAVMPEAIKKHMDTAVAAISDCLLVTAYALDTAIPLVGRAGLWGAGALAKYLRTTVDKNSGSQPSPENFQHQDNGRSFYEIHKTLEQITRPKQNDPLFKNNAFKGNFRIDFVVFVDDLDRCLPEKAVQTLELIKTVFNVDSFAFVLALDDEVIERGIGHRYKEYNLQNKKPQMPITGFEYLEKIVHLPFRLPQLTREQARGFLLAKEEDIAKPLRTERWFSVRLHEREQRQALQDVQMHASRPESSITPIAQLAPSTLSELFLWSFEAYVPRKMVRAIELMHQVAAIAEERKRPLATPNAADSMHTTERSGGRDERVVFALLLLQLFQPELFRLMRRQVGAFPVLLNAFTGTAGGLNSAEVSEIELWTWATFPDVPDASEASEATGTSSAQASAPPASASKKKSSANPQARITNAAQALARISQIDASKRYNAQQLRLPIVEKLVEHMQVQRHVFNPIKLMHKLAGMLGDSARTLDIAPYYSLLGAETSAAVQSAAASAVGIPMPSVTGKVTLEQEDTSRAAPSRHTPSRLTPSRPIFSRVNDISAMVQALTARDSAEQANLASKLQLPEGRVLDVETVTKLHEALSVWLGQFKADAPAKLQPNDRLLLTGLSYLSPFVDWATGGSKLWSLVAPKAQPPVEFQALMDFTQSLTRMAKAGWLSEEATVSATQSALLGYFKGVQKPKERAAAGDALGALGDPRFEGTFALPKRTAGDAPEVPPGFVKIEPAAFYFGNVDKPNMRHTKPYYMGRYLVTVAQYKAFLNARDASNPSSPAPAALAAGRQGAINSQNSPHMPAKWEEQQATPNRPVTFVKWADAMAYTAWLEAQRQLGALGDISPIAPGYCLRLPTEAEWERAARAGRDYQYPWGEGTADIAQRANVENSVDHATAVGAYPANALGLHDMAGNVWELQGNVYAKVYESALAVPNKRAGDTYPALRGGSWSNSAGFARCSIRDWNFSRRLVRPCGVSGGVVPG